MENEAQLASVLGHEIAHTTYEHARLQMHKDKVINSFSIFTQFAAIAGVIPAELSVLVSAFGGPALSSKFARDFEEQADRAGLTYMSQAGYDPREAAKVWKRLVDRTAPQEDNFGANTERALEKGINSIYASHPEAQKRYKTLNRLISLNYYDTTFETMKTNASEYKRQMKALGRWLKMKGATIYEAEPEVVKPNQSQINTVSSGPTTQTKNKTILPTKPDKETIPKKKPKS
jgi:predicted Zn-dependent protease